jgi:hypothetical protein
MYLLEGSVFSHTCVLTTSRPQQARKLVERQFLKQFGMILNREIYCNSRSCNKYGNIKEHMTAII